MEKRKYRSYLIMLFGIILIIVGITFIMTNETKGKKEEKETVDETKIKTYPYLQVVTARYGATEEYKEFIDNVFGDNAEEKFRNYFQWYNVVHELTHGMIIYNNNQTVLEHTFEYNNNGYIEEMKVNDFAVAFWKTYGEQEKIDLLKETVDYILSNMTDPTDGKLTTEEYGKLIWGDNDLSFEKYGWFQFNSVRESLDKDLTLLEAYNNLGLNKKVSFDDIKLNYLTINEDICNIIVKDTADKFIKWGLNYPRVLHMYDDDPNTNYSNPITKSMYEELIMKK